MILQPDGTIIVQMPRKQQDAEGSWVTAEGTEDVTLRRPTLEELFELWETVDKMTAENVAPAESPAVGKEEKPPERATRNAITIMKQNAQFVREAIDSLGTPKVYIRETDKKTKGVVFRLREGLGEPSWFASATNAGQLLRHWQEVPLAPGNGPTR